MDALSGLDNLHISVKHSKNSKFENGRGGFGKVYKQSDMGENENIKIRIPKPGNTVSPS